jgi:nicotinate dehydrogenase subunit B
VIREDNTATFYVGKTDLGQGTGTAFRQIMCDELDIAYEKTSCVMGSTDVTVDQGGSGGSDALQTDGWPMRRVAAEARRVLLEMASELASACRSIGAGRQRRRGLGRGRSVEAACPTAS